MLVIHGPPLTVRLLQSSVAQLQSRCPVIRIILTYTNSCFHFSFYPMHLPLSCVGPSHHDGLPADLRSVPDQTEEAHW